MPTLGIAFFVHRAISLQSKFQVPKKLKDLCKEFFFSNDLHMA